MDNDDDDDDDERGSMVRVCRGDWNEEELHD